MRLNPVNLITNTDQYFGKKITRITDNEGNDLFDLHMQYSIIFIFSDGDKLSLALDWYGQDCYISQKTTD